MSWLSRRAKTDTSWSKPFHRLAVATCSQVTVYVNVHGFIEKVDGAVCHGNKATARMITPKSTYDPLGMPDKNATIRRIDLIHRSTNGRRRRAAVSGWGRRVSRCPRPESGHGSNQGNTFSMLASEGKSASEANDARSSFTGISGINASCYLKMPFFEPCQKL